MAMKVISGYNDSEWEAHKDMFYANFNPDDWDYMIIGDGQWDVDYLASKLYVCDYEVKEIGDKWVAVTYHA